MTFSRESCFTFEDFSYNEDNNGNPFMNQIDLSEVNKTIQVSEKIDFNYENNDYLPSQFTRKHWISHKARETSTSLISDIKKPGIRNASNKVYRPAFNTTDSDIAPGKNSAHQTHTEYIDDLFEPLPIHPPIEASFSQKVETETQTNTRAMSALSDTSKSITNGIFKRRMSGMQALELFSNMSDFKYTEDLLARSVSPCMFSDSGNRAGTPIFEYLTTEVYDKTEENPKTHTKDQWNSNHDSFALDGILIPSMKRMQTLTAKSRLSQSRLQEWDKKNGLPRSHCHTMMHTNRSRRQLEEGRILPKWNGNPLIGTDNIKKSSAIPKRRKKQANRKHSKF